jgi:hypothetical protein
MKAMARTPRRSRAGKEKATITAAPGPAEHIQRRQLERSVAWTGRTAAIILALGLAVGVPAAAAAQQPPSPAGASTCSEVCSGGGYGSGTSTTTQPAYSIPIILNNLDNQGNPAPCSEVCSGGGYGLVSQPSRTPDDSSAYHAARIPLTAGRAVTAGAGFHWGDAGIGAGGMLALIVIGIGGALTVTHRRNQRIHG